ncbi:MAG: type II toxin-antitoxin system RelE/ParE family toxin [Lachnospiraceae bacterium]|nr:type II toxin-antitoxin system RelE/ParE family toxin [Lachnospiraceae bacterium]
MNERHYKLRFLPLFEDDLNEIADYIAVRLKNPIAAERLVDDVQEAIRARLSCAESFEPYHSVRERQYPYYRINVRNYTIFYVVIDDVMEVRRIIYSRRDLSRQI